jgi:hypothetical protein
MFLAGKSPNIRSYTVYIYGTGQRCEYNAESTSLGLAHVYPCVFVFAGDCPGHVGTLATLLGVSVCICVPPVALDTWAPWPRCLACLCAFVCRRLPWTRGRLGHVAWCVCVYLCAAACPGHVGALATLLGVSVCICVPPVALDTWAPWPRCLACLCAFVCRRLHWTRGHLGHVACDPTTISVDLVSVGCFGAMML